MTTVDFETYEGQLTDLDLDYVRERGRWINAHLAPAGEPVGLSYSPGNGTVYRLVFVPVRGINQLDEERVPVGVPHDDLSPVRWVLLVKCNGTDSDFVYPFDLTEGHLAHEAYVREHTGLGIADSSAITALLRAVCGVPVEGGRPGG